jgi:His/Glu/Gln/Arg/opine family amino acid ABC transporter permease subunit
MLMDDNSQNPNHAAQFVRTDEPKVKPPPVLETGALKWLRENLFSSSLNTVLTFAGIFILVYSLSSMINWAVREANWHAVIFNLRLLMVGRFSPEHEWRIGLLVLISSFIMGAAIAVWVKKIARLMLVTTIMVGIVTLLLPITILGNGNVPLPIFYMSTGNVPVVIGNSNEATIETIAFIGREGERIRITLADNLNSDTALANMAGFMDRASNTLRNGAGNRLRAIERRNFLVSALEENGTLEIPRLTANQVEAYNTEAAAFTEAAPIIETFQLNQNPVRISIINAETLEEISPTIELNAENAFNAAIPETGWYILTKTYLPSASIPEGISLLSVEGIYPLLQSSSFDSTVGGFVDDFVRMSDTTRLSAPLPQINGENVRFVSIIENKYFGARSLGDYLSAYLAPFLKAIGLPLVSYFMLGIAGYWFTVMLDKTQGKHSANNFAAVALALLPVIFWILVNGMYAFTALMWFLVVAMLFAAVYSYQFWRRYGATGKTQRYTVLVMASFYAILLVTQHLREFELSNYLRLYTLLIEPAGLPRFILWLSGLILGYAAYSGYKAHKVDTESPVNVAFGWFSTLFILIAVSFLLGFPESSLLPRVTLATEWLLQPSQPNDWGGLLLVMAITIYGIIIAFPIGVGLALGRRSELPIIRNICIGYIELVRGVPFITVLFFIQLLLPLLNPELAELSNTYRAIIATILFSAAYLAENVRGGLQSLPPGQSEAAKALGLSTWQMTLLITMPQALRAVIPALVGQFISLFKDTSLVAIVGLSDLVKIVDTINAQTAFGGTKLEGLFFISVIYFVFSYVMGYVSRLLEASGSGVTRRM